VRYAENLIAFSVFWGFVGLNYIMKMVTICSIVVIVSNCIAITGWWSGAAPCCSQGTRHKAHGCHGCCCAIHRVIHTKFQASPLFLCLHSQCRCWTWVCNLCCCWALQTLLLHSLACLRLL